MTAKRAKVLDTSFLQHAQESTGHGKHERNVCWGLLKNGASCSNKAGLNNEGLLPMCGTHQSQRRIRGECKAVLDCGLVCGRWYEWVPLQFGLCPDHENLPNKPCFLLKIPTEIRLRIYSFLLPNKPITSRYRKLWDLRSDSRPVSSSILGTNRQIHSEGIDLMYSQATFCIEISNAAIIMFNTAHTPTEIPPSQLVRPDLIGSCQNIQDYQMQLMLLDLQNRTRLFMKDSGLNHQLTFEGPLEVTSLALVPDLLEGEYGPIWYPSLSEPLFRLIRSFDIQIQLPLSYSVGLPDTITVPQMFHPSNGTELLEKAMYQITDQLHQLVGRLELIKPCINNIRITVMITGFEESKEALAAVPILLRPFLRLRNVVRPNVESIHWRTNIRTQFIELLAPTCTDRAENKFISRFLTNWKAEISNPGPNPEAPITTQAYWLLHAMIVDILYHRKLDCTFDFKFDDDLCSARIARESNDIFGIHEVWQNVIRKWNEYGQSQRSLDDRVCSSISLLKGIMCKAFEQAVITPNVNETDGKEKEKSEDNVDLEDEFSWENEDGTRFTYKDGFVRAQLLTPSLVSCFSVPED
jgi:hypothetical protein